MFDMMKLIVVSVTLLTALKIAGAISTVNCVTDCTGKGNGDYNSCDSCGEFVTCSESALSKNDCQGDLVFDDDIGRCEYRSNTCTECVTDCTGKTNGNYSSCDSCSEFVTCREGDLTKHQCPGDKLYDAFNDSCNYNSRTCADTSTTAVTESSSSERRQSSSSYSQTTAAPPTKQEHSTTTKQTSVKQTSTAPTTSHAISTRSSDWKSSTSPNDSEAHQKMNWYIKAQGHPDPCFTNVSALKITFVRSTIDCGRSCTLQSNCWYFQHVESQCLMYELSFPPCSEDFYKYNGIK